MSGLSDGTTGTNKYKPYLVALEEIGATANIFKGMILAGYKGKNYLISFDGEHRDWFGAIENVTSPEEAVSKVRE